MASDKTQTLKVCHLYPNEMNTYADRGNIAVLKRRLEWRGFNFALEEFEIGDALTDATEFDLFYMGGGQDINQIQVAKDLAETKAQALHDALLGKADTPHSIPPVGLFVCGGYQLAGHFYNIYDQQLRGIGVLGVHTIQNESHHNQRLTGTIKIKTELPTSTSQSSQNIPLEIVGYENHAGRTQIIDMSLADEEHTEYKESASKSFGEVLVGHGNNGADGTEGAITARTIGTYIHGPLLPKNPELADLLIAWGLEHRYGAKAQELASLNNSFAEVARAEIS